MHLPHMMPHTNGDNPLAVFRGSALVVREVLREEINDIAEIVVTFTIGMTQFTTVCAHISTTL